ncbi:HD-GYP domain-containing protein [Ornithinimicrobium avium]|uniref:HD domain-containing protein n=1 Tax=Ornithinimicrobium avium TaxID=2283195 RepID=A0A345NRL8_9MICO|nr:HD domain-containing phosphohydrolase [Ornithinimicrobium avium]AXH97676.1 hypothetical protein DV701_17565 [Ornithinimicrobium avium]
MALTPELALVALLAMIVGEAWRVSVPGVGQDAPLSQATAAALAVSTAWPAHDDPDHLLGLLGPLVLACLAVLVVAAARRSWWAVPPDLARTVSTVLVAGLLARVPLLGSASLLERAEAPGAQAPTVALLLLVVSVIAVVAPVLGRAAVQAAREGSPLRVQITDHLARHGALMLATATTAAVMALSVRLLGAASFVLFLVPMALLQPAVTRQRRIREAQRQTIFALSRLTDQAGLTTPGHGVRVARTAVPVAREAGVEDADLADVEAAALLHDIGQVGLTRPIPGGATVEVSARDQRRVAATGAAILARTADLSRLASTVGDVGIPQHWAEQRGDVPMSARVVRVVSAFDDLTGAGTRLGGGHGPVEALERILRSTPHEYDPQVVDALVRHLERRGLLAASDAVRLRTAATAPDGAGTGT